MRVGLTVSIIGHAAIIGWGFFAFPQAQPFQAQNVDALPVDLVSVGDVTDLLKGNKNSKIAPKDNPQPKPEVAAATPSPAPPKEAPQKPVEASAPPPPPPPPPPEPQPAPTPPAPQPEQVASLPHPSPEPAPEVAPAPQVTVTPNIPRPRPNPPKPVAEPKPQPQPTQDVAQAAAPDPAFNPDKIAALLNKETPAGGGDPAPATEPQTIGSIEGHADAAMTQSEISALKARLYRCWNPPVAVRNAANLVVTVHISLLPDGSLAGAPQVVRVSEASDPVAQVAAESAVRAVVQCAPFGDILQPDKYALWNQIEFVFDPRQMAGG